MPVYYCVALNFCGSLILRIGDFFRILRGLIFAICRKSRSNGTLINNNFTPIYFFTYSILSLIWLIAIRLRSDSVEL